MKTIKFTSISRDGSPYRCSVPRDQSGYYVPADVAQVLLEALEAVTEAYAYEYGEDCPLALQCREAIARAKGV